MRRSQSVRRALYALVVLVTFMVVLRMLRPDSPKAVIPYEKVVDEIRAQHEVAHEQQGTVPKDTVPKDTVPKQDTKPNAAVQENSGPIGPPFDAEAAYKEIVYGLPYAPLVIFSKSYCPHSKRAKQLLLEDHLIVPTPKVIELDQHSNGPELQDFLAQLTSRRTVPNILVNGISRGGASDMVDLGDQLTAKIQEWGGGQLTVEPAKVHIQPVAAD